MDDEQSRLQTLVKESLTSMCKSCLNYDSCITVEGLIAVTIDYDRVILIQLNESTQKANSLVTPENVARKSLNLRIKKSTQSRNKTMNNEYNTIEELDNLTGNSDVILGLIENDSPNSKLFANSLCPTLARQQVDLNSLSNAFASDSVCSAPLVTPPLRLQRPVADISYLEGSTSPLGFNILSRSSKAKQRTFEKKKKEWLMNKDIVNMIAKCVMRENGSFVTSRMLSRGYASYHKSHEIICGMQAVCKPLNSEHHIGLFRLVNDRTKVFYKCPPDLIPLSALDHFYMTLKQYTEHYEQPPRRNKSMNDERWSSYIESMKQLSPYVNIGGRTDYLLAKICWDDRNPMTVLERELLILNTSDILSIQKQFLITNGCYVVVDTNEENQQKISQMKHISKRSRLDSLYFGHFKSISNKLNVFFKSPPSLISDEALSLIQINRDQYEFSYKSCFFLESTTACKVLCHWPFNRGDLPLSSFSLSEDMILQIESSLGVLFTKDYEISFDSPLKKKSKKDTDSIDSFSLLQCSTSNTSNTLPFELDLSNPIIADLTDKVVDDDRDLSPVSDVQDNTDQSNAVQLSVADIKKELCS